MGLPLLLLQVAQGDCNVKSLAHTQLMGCKVEAGEGGLQNHGLGESERQPWAGAV